MGRNMTSFEFAVFTVVVLNVFAILLIAALRAVEKLIFRLMELFAGNSTSGGRLPNPRIGRDR